MTEVRVRWLWGAGALARPWVRIVAYVVLLVCGGLGLSLVVPPDYLQPAFCVFLLALHLGLEALRATPSLRTSGFSASWAKEIPAGMAHGLGGIAFIAGVALLAGAASGIGSDSDAVQVLDVAVGMLWVGISEELMFRGVIFEALGQWIGQATTVILTSALFAAAHIFNPGVTLFALLNVFFAGVWLGILVIRTRSLWAAIAAHWTWNAAQALVFGAVSGVYVPGAEAHGMMQPEWLWGGAFGIEAGAITSLFLVAASAIAVLTLDVPAGQQALLFVRRAAEDRIRYGVGSEVEDSRFSTIRVIGRR